MRLEAGLSWCLVAFAAFIVVSTLCFTALSHNAIPQGDEWDSFAVYDTILRSGDTLAHLFQRHNEHRLFFPRLILFSDYRWFGGLGLFDKAVILLVQGLHAGLFVWLIRRSGAGAAAARALSAVVVVLLFSLYQSENFQWAFQVQFVGVFACASLCCVVFARGLEAARTGRPFAGAMMAAACLAVVATFSMANGILIGPVLVVVAVMARGRASVILATAAVSAALILAFSFGYHLESDHESAAQMMRHLTRIVAFAAGYLGNFARFGAESQIALGAAGLIATAALAGRFVLRRDPDPVRLALLGIALFTIGSAALTALGRSADGLDGMTASRYSTGAATFWAATLVHGWSLSRSLGSGVALRATLLRAVVSTAALVLLEASFWIQVPMGLSMQVRVADFGAIEDAMLLGLLDRPALARLEEPADRAVDMAPVLRRLNLSIFRGRDAGLIGRPLSDVETPTATALACSGTFDGAIARPDLGPDGVAVSGTSRLRLRFGRPGRIYLVDAARRIVGFARTAFLAGGWRGYALAKPGTELAAYAVSDAGRTCRLASLAVSPAEPSR